MKPTRICLAGVVLAFSCSCAVHKEPTSNGLHFSSSKLQILATMQQHSSWVSRGGASQVRHNLENAGFRLLGDGVFGGGATSGSRAYVAEKGGIVVVAFRGTLAGGLAYFQNVATDASAVPRGLKLGDTRLDYAKVHTGFQRDYNKLRPKILAALDEAQGRQLYLCGHSLGAALATICAYDLSKNYRGKFSSINPIVSGSPRVGDEGFRRAFNGTVSKHIRVAIHGDPVVNSPGKLGVHKYAHVGREILITADGRLIPPGSNPPKKKSVHARGAYHTAISQLVGNLVGSSSSAAAPQTTLASAPQPKTAPETANPPKPRKPLVVATPVKRETKIPAAPEAKELPNKPKITASKLKPTTSSLAASGDQNRTRKVRPRR